VRILVVEDQKDLNEIISRKLKKEGYAVDSCHDGKEALLYMKSAEYDGIVLDIMLPELSGIEVLKKARERGDNTPILLLTALGEVEDRVAGLDAGADDYLVKPFDFEELLARIRTMIRRRSSRATSIIKYRDLEVNTASREVRRGGKLVDLTTREYNILEYMLHNTGRALTRDNLSAHIWNYDYDGGSNVIDVYVHRLRKKLEAAADKDSDIIVETIKGVGYIIRE
jgi:DNA-binding response OmpR family regulator